MKVTVIGAGLAGCEAAYQITRFNIPVKLIEMKPKEFSPAHSSPHFAELVCSNSLKANRIENACGLLKEEMRQIGSIMMDASAMSGVPAGGALAVDREIFSGYITDKIKNNPLIEIEEKTVDEIPNDPCVIIATGPLTQGKLFENIKSLIGATQMHFFDAAAPIVFSDSINMEIAFKQSRYQKGGDDYINCPMNREEYLAFWNALISADTADVHEFDNKSVFEGCMPIEVMANRGEDTIRFGPMKPVGLVDPRTGNEAYACVQLRQDDTSASIFNLVGFQTRLKIKEQERVFRMIPGLENVEFARYGVMHRNTYINSPGVLNSAYQCIERPNIFFAGQITGVEGYVESMSSGMMAGINAALFMLKSDKQMIFPTTTVTGALSHYISDKNIRNFQPMNANFGIVDTLNKKIRKKEDRYREVANLSLSDLKENLVLLNQY